MKIVEVEWIDSSGFSGGAAWQSKEDVIRQAGDEETMSCWSVGYVVCEDERQVTLTLGHNGEGGMVMDPTMIPRVAILSMRRLDVGLSS